MQTQNLYASYVEEFRIFLNRIREEKFLRREAIFRDLNVKSRNQLVTDVDLEMENLIVAFIRSLEPGAAFLTEEQTTDQDSGSTRWIIDPIDGTTNFVHGVPLFCSSIALELNAEIALAIVYEWNSGECFHAIRGAGAYLNDRRIRVSESVQLSDALIATGFPYYDYDRTGKYLRALEQFMRETRGVRRLGSAAMDLAYVACGRFDAFFEYSLKPWDVAAGVLLVREAGGMLSDFGGGSNYIYGSEIIAAQPQIITDVQHIIAHAFKKK